MKTGTFPAEAVVVVDETKSRTPEWGRKAILGGWIVAMLGIAGYVYSMIDAPQEAGLFEALLTGGMVAWLSAALVIVGVALWLAGNLALLRGLSGEERN
jgi:hypothetical protein